MKKEATEVFFGFIFSVISSISLAEGDVSRRVESLFLQVNSHRTEANLHF
jgi:hypothetical protein